MLSFCDLTYHDYWFAALGHRYSERGPQRSTVLAISLMANCHPQPSGNRAEQCSVHSLDGTANALADPDDGLVMVAPEGRESSNYATFLSSSHPCTRETAFPIRHGLNLIYMFQHFVVWPNEP